jgi:hypothetical protein
MIYVPPGYGFGAKLYGLDEVRLTPASTMVVRRARGCSSCPFW